MGCRSRRDGDSVRACVRHCGLRRAPSRVGAARRGRDSAVSGAWGYGGWWPGRLEKEDSGFEKVEGYLCCWWVCCLVGPSDLFVCGPFQKNINGTNTDVSSSKRDPANTGGKHPLSFPVPDLIPFPAFPAWFRGFSRPFPQNPIYRTNMEKWADGNVGIALSIIIGAARSLRVWNQRPRRCFIFFSTTSLPPSLHFVFSLAVP